LSHSLMHQNSYYQKNWGAHMPNGEALKNGSYNLNATKVEVPKDKLNKYFSICKLWKSQILILLYIYK
jgi:hypothetical protein